MSDSYSAPLDAALVILMMKGVALGQALALEQELEDDRAAIKADAIVRVMKRDGLAATPAEKIVETDEQYFQHRAKQSASIVARYRADAEYHAAKAAATQASLITPNAIELRATVVALSRDLGIAKRELDVKEVQLRRANGQIADLIRERDNVVSDPRFG